MEPFAIQANPGLIHPAATHLQGDLSAVLREGRVLAGEVLESFAGGSLLIGIGRHRVPADAQVRMQPGQRFLFQVEGSGDQVVLRVLAEGAAGDDALLRALRSVVGQDRPVGELLSALAASLRALPGGGEALEGLASQLARFLFLPGSGGAALQQLLIGAGLSYEARLAAVAARTLPAGQARGLASELRGWLLGALTGADDARSPAGSPGLADALRTQLAALLGGGLPDVDLEQAFSRWLAGDPLGAGAGRAPTDLASLLQRALAELPGANEGLQAALARLDVSALGRPLGGMLLRSLLGLAPEGLALGSAAVQAELAGLAAGFGDLKARLLRALSSAGSLEGAAAETLDRALAGLEAEQLMNVARARSREPMHWSFPVPEGADAAGGDPTAGRWATAHLFFRRLSDGGHQHDAEGGEVDVHRLTLAVDFTSTGPLRADLVARPGSLALRLLATREDVVERLRGGLNELETRLALGGRRVHLSLACAPAEKVRVDDAGQDIRFLREHHLMDRKG